MHRRLRAFSLIRVLILALGLLPLVSQATSGISTVYGEDDRRDLYDVTTPQVLRAARATVMLVENKSLGRDKAGRLRLKGSSYREDYNLCEGERFSEQEVFGFCSGVLVTPELVLTAGHCLMTEEDCRKTAFVFDVAYAAPGRILRTLSQERVRRCERIVKRRNRKDGVDFALVQLDQPISGRASAIYEVDKDNPERVFMLGYPLGLPLKYSGIANVTSASQIQYTTNLDTSSGNSGSPVFDQTTGALVGILTSGEPDDFQKTKAGCYVSKSCTEKSCMGEFVLRIDVIREHL